ncbi:thioredoxin domain-containing protein [Corynebacterium lizhenjunii]|uniref:Thioredoxin domain-containing protein n=1 Tax=Corynebacterium lizhenjunii TaxID=2709394 RepID=A0A7T0PC66_9CORY|nr:thioredoxin domain-containing protein [Corynebacterium lizhenjunii]QPK79367.1 thioredoxin domain-containing protein [Corynebacterium lizhenjunii]
MSGSSRNPRGIGWPVLVLAIIVAAAVAGLAVYAFTRPDNGTQLAESTASGSPSNSATEVNGEEAGASASSGTPDRGKGATLWGPGVELSQLSEAAQVHRRLDGDPFASGRVDAPVVMSEFSDFECPFCARHANEVEPQLRKLVDEGTLRIEWNDFPVNGDAATAAAKAGRAAAEQGKFEQFKRELYSASKDVAGHPNYGIEDFVRFAKQAGVADLERFRADATSNKYDQAIAHARDYASQIGISGTPAFIVGGQFISGAQPVEVFLKAIEEEAAAARP